MFSVVTTPAKEYDDEKDVTQSARSYSQRAYDI